MIRFIDDDFGFLERYMNVFIDLGKGEKRNIYNVEECSLSGSYERIETKFKQEAVKQGINLLVKKPDAGIKVKADLQAIEYRVIFNLIDNAFRYTPEGGTIELNYELKDGLFIGRVKDSGKGLAKENLGKIFEEGFQIEDGKKGLAGLGLAIIQEVMNAHSGKIWVDSEGEGKGAAFYFTLPLA